MFPDLCISDRIAKLIVEGEIDATSAPEILEKMSEADMDLVDRVEMDFSGVSYVSSAALRAFVIMKRKLGDKELHIDNVSPDIDNLLRETGFDCFPDYSVSDPEQDICHMSFKDFLGHKVTDGPGKALSPAPISPIPGRI